ncbi:MAG: hypothetical protein KJO69_00145 [Gammaproteobacteria bacterium]|nr:hypothetical protein [Gammaproteobacteria bacterium]
MNVEVGARIRFAEEKQAYTVQASGKRYKVCTKPFNLKKTVLYTVVDMVEKVRGTENLIFCAGAETKEQCNEMLERLESGETAVSFRNRIPLAVDKIMGSTNDR